MNIRPYPVSITLDPYRIEIYDDIREGTFATHIHVQMSDDSPFRGTVTSDGPLTLMRFDMTTMVFSRDLTPADDGAHAWHVMLASGASAVLAVQVNAAAPPPTLQLNPSSVAFPDDTPAGTLVTTLTMSDGSAIDPTTVTVTDENNNPAPVTIVS